jgi:hypothetical protein
MVVYKRQRLLGDGRCWYLGCGVLGEFMMVSYYD